MTTPPTATAPAPTAWSALSDRTFRGIWIAGVILSTGTVLQDVTSGWLMTTLTPDPLKTALLQTAVSLPVLIFALPAGAVADIVNRRRLMIRLLLAQALLLVILGAIAFWGGLTPPLLLAMTFLSGSCVAIFTPSWMRTVPDLLSGPRIPFGVTLNSTAVNMARVTGASLAGALLAIPFTGLGYFAASLALLAPVLALYRWKGQVDLSKLPRESFSSALGSGLRYALHSKPIQAVAARTLAFSLFASAIPALLPVVGRQELRLGSFEFSLLSAGFGGGALLGATILMPIRKRYPLDQLVLAMTAVLAASAVGMALVHSFVGMLGVLVAAGAAWVTMVSSFGVATGSASAPWVLSRMLSLYMLMFQGGAAVGSFLWGQLARSFGVNIALEVAAVGLVAGMTLVRWAPMPAAHPHLLAPAQHWPAPPTVKESGTGPVLVTVEYIVADEDRATFFTAMNDVRHERLRDGAWQWHLFESAEQPGHYLEHFLLSNWTDHLRQHERVTHADRDPESLARSLHRGPDSFAVRHWLGQ